VAFSGTVQDDKLAGVTYTEVGMNLGISGEGAAREVRVAGVPGPARRREVPDRIRPAALHTMYVDKRLAGIQAVQTLSR
jgi:type I restriction enzyme R subunit